MNDLYRKLKMRDDGFLGMEDDAVLLWVVPATIDYEAAGEEVWMLIQTMPPTPPGQTEPSKVRMEWMGQFVFDAALGGD